MDYNGDGLEDLIVGERSGYANYFRRNSDGTLRATIRLKANGQEIDAGDNSSPQVTDWNGDGLLDLLVCGDMQEGVRLYLNSGTPSAYKYENFTLLKTSTNQEIKYYRSQIRVVDLNQDGKQDLILADGLVPNSCFRFFENIGEDDAPVLKDAVKLKYTNGTAIEDPNYDIRFCVTDWNEDGGLDIVWSDYGDAPLYLLLGEVPTGIKNDYKQPKSNMLSNIVIKSRTVSAQLTLRSLHHVRFDIVSVKGQLIQSEEIGGLQTGIHQISINLGALPSGMYLVQCVGDGVCIEKTKITLMK